MNLRRRIRLTVFFGIIILLLLFWNDYWGISKFQGMQPSGDTPSSSTSSSADSSAQTGTATDSLARTMPDSVRQKRIEEAMRPDTLQAAPPTEHEETLLQDTAVVVAEEVLYNLIEVKKRRNGELFYRINGKDTGNLVEGLTTLFFEKPTLLKIDGNITYAEEQEVKEILSVKEVEYKETAQ